jgi:hypothetical protein
MVLCDVVNCYGTHEASNRANAVGHPHQDAGIARRNVEVVDVETCSITN